MNRRALDRSLSMSSPPSINRDRASDQGGSTLIRIDRLRSGLTNIPPCIGLGPSSRRSTRFASRSRRLCGARTSTRLCAVASMRSRRAMTTIASFSRAARSVITRSSRRGTRGRPSPSLRSQEPGRSRSVPGLIDGHERDHGQTLLPRKRPFDRRRCVVRGQAPPRRHRQQARASRRRSSRRARGRER